MLDGCKSIVCGVTCFCDCSTVRQSLGDGHAVKVLYLMQIILDVDLVLKDVGVTEVLYIKAFKQIKIVVVEYD